MLFAREGRWEGRQLISRGWVEESTRGHQHRPFPGLPVFLVGYTPGRVRLHHFSARGNYGQYIYVAPEKDLVIVRLGKEEGEQGYDYWIYLFEELATKLDTPAKESQ